MELSTGSTVGSSNSDSGSYGGSTTTSGQPADTGPLYRNFEIWKPASEESIINTGGQVTVNVRIDPSLQMGHSIYLYLDGRPLNGFPSDTTSFNLTDVSRGTHSVMAAVVDSVGTRLQETASVTFFVRQESVAEPPVGPSMRPSPPKPQPRPRASNKMPTSQPTYAALNQSAERAPINPATNMPVVTKPTVSKPVTPAPRQGK
ncbi:MAG TPA: hypothetical protein VKB34_23140 [Povalibacter sp.]|nr:hypothetical protein [Povalibacter sp.]